MRGVVRQHVQVRWVPWLLLAFSAVSSNLASQATPQRVEPVGVALVRDSTRGKRAVRGALLGAGIGAGASALVNVLFACAECDDEFWSAALGGAVLGAIIGAVAGSETGALTTGSPSGWSHTAWRWP